MHGKHRHTDIDDLDIEAGHILRHGAAAPFVDLAELTRLPNNAGAVKNIPDAAHKLGARVGGTALAAGARIFCNDNPLVEIGRVEFIKHRREGRVKRRVDIRRKAFRTAKDIPRGQAFRVREGGYEILEIPRFQTGVFLAARFLLVGENGDGRI